jgi:hypothetical protein
MIMYPRKLWPILCTLLGLVISIASWPAHSQRVSADSALSNDLRKAIILEGYQCSRITELFQIAKADYRVSCDADRQYRVRISEENMLVIASLSSSATGAPQGGTAHDEYMKKQLFAIVNLAGHDCNSVISYERSGPLGHTVICDNQTVYRIRVTPEGRVAVDKQAIEK